MTTENSAVFSLEEIGRALYHTGYTIQNPVLTMSLGIPALTQPAFLVYGAMTRVPESQKQVVQMLLGRLDVLDNEIFEARAYLTAEKLGEMTINLEVCNNLEREYTRQASRLADILGCILSPYSDRWNYGKQALNVRVRQV